MERLLVVITLLDIKLIVKSFALKLLKSQNQFHKSNFNWLIFAHPNINSIRNKFGFLANNM